MGSEIVLEPRRIIYFCLVFEVLMTSYFYRNYYYTYLSVADDDKI
jgi:hypothetical protein